MHIVRVAMGVALGFGVASCAGDPYAGPKENTGTFLGALSGAVIGSQFGGGSSGHFAGALAGAAIGGLLGNRIGATLDEEDRRWAYEAQLRALESGQAGAPVGWRSQTSGRYGSIVP